MDPVSDIAIIGSGIACTATLINLFEQLLSNPAKQHLHITVIEKYTENWKGLPYGSRSSVNALTITTIDDFFTDKAENRKFFDWFTSNVGYILADYEAIGGANAKVWLRDNIDSIKREAWNNVYLPRYIIGNYLHQKLMKLSGQVQKSGSVVLETISGECTGIKNADNKFHIHISDSSITEIVSKKIILAIGSAPERQLCNNLQNQRSVAYINRIYEPSMEENLLNITKRLEALPLSQRNLLVVGSNASTIELLYLIRNNSKLLQSLNDITVLSSSGKLPAHITYKQSDGEVCANLKKLTHVEGYNIEALVDAASMDIKAMPDHEVSIPDVDQVIAFALKLLEPLDDNVKKLFYGVYGVQLAKLFRRSGTDYKKATDELIKKGKLKVLKGVFSGIEIQQETAILNYFDLLIEKPVKLTKPFNVIINCTGSDDLVNSDSQLIQSLIKYNNCKVNSSNKAFEVNDNLEAAPGLYIIGPLVGGNYNKLLSFWHLENASRILYLSKHLANQLLLT